MEFQLIGPVRKYKSKGKESKNYAQKFRLKGESKVRSVSLGTNSKRVAEQRRDDRIRTKIEELQTKNDPHHRTTKSSIGESLAEYTKSHGAKGNTAKQTTGTENKINRVIVALGFETYGDIDPVKIENYISNMDGAVATRNRYIESMKSWSNWMYQEGRWPTNLLVRLKKFPAQATKQYGILTNDNYKKLLDYMTTAPDSRNLSGEDRFWMYQIATQSGLRASELAKLTPGMFHLDVDHPFVELPAEFSKRGKKIGKPDQIILNRRFADKLRPWLEELADSQPI